jgi:hypothetical protein
MDGHNTKTSSEDIPFGLPPIARHAMAALDAMQSSYSRLVPETLPNLTPEGWWAVQAGVRNTGYRQATARGIIVPFQEKHRTAQWLRSYHRALMYEEMLLPR